MLMAIPVSTSLRPSQFSYHHRMPGPAFRSRRRLRVIFGIDDSEIDIEGCPHTLLAAIGVRNPETLESALAVLKRDFGLKASDEVKWNGMPPLPQKAREQLTQQLMVLLHDSVPLVVITEDRDKNQAAQASAR